MDTNTLNNNWKKLLDYATQLGFDTQVVNEETDDEGYRTLDVLFDYDGE
jgi:hypothetical protein